MSTNTRNSFMLFLNSYKIIDEIKKEGETKSAYYMSGNK